MEKAEDGTLGRVDPDVIRIGDREFRRGESGVVEGHIAHMIDYQPVTMTVHVRRGRRPGPVLLISAALHGDEIIGVEIIRRLLKEKRLRGLRGTLIAAPVVNMPAFIYRSRYLPDRRDLNRLFPGSTKGSLGARLAHFFTNEVVAHAHFAIDMHTGAVNRPNLPQIRVSTGDVEALKMAKAFKAPVILESGLREGSLRQTYWDNGVPSLLYEAGEAHRMDAKAVVYGVRGVASVMRSIGMLRPEKEETQKSLRRHRTVMSSLTAWVRAPHGGVFTPAVDLGNAVTPGMVLGIVADPFGKHETPIASQYHGVVIGKSSEATLDEGDGIFHVALTEEAEEAERAEASIQKSTEGVGELETPSA